MFIRPIFLLGFLVMLPTLVLGWGKDGHETVGYLAASLIGGSNADKEVKKLLKADETLATAAEWPDCAKGFRYCHKQPTAEMKDFAQRNPNHHAYHYTDVPFELDEYADEAPGASADDVVHILEDAILVLQGQSPANPQHNITQREALFILAHMVGDIHQPLHVGAAYIDEARDYVVPENQEEATADFTQGGNLMCHGSKGVHSYWDDNLVTSSMKKAKVTTSKAFAAKLATSAKKVKANEGAIGTWPRAWATESLNLSKTELSVLTVTDKRTAGATSVCQKTGKKGANDVWDVDFPGDYAAEGTDTATEQLTLAGARLARVLKTIWP
jgi:S1/P1 Nuclease